MNLSKSIARNTLIGVVVALVLASTAAMASSGPCPVSTTCAPGQPLSGYTIECGCMGSGSCAVLSEGYGIICACDGFYETVCDCVQGCKDRIPPAE
jgi:hypothetical protein